MIIYLEGADCAGKSLLTSQLQRALRDEYDVYALHAGRPDPNVDILRQYLVPLYEALGSRRALIIDRWHLGELVYGPLRRSGSRLSLGQAAYVDLVMQTYGFRGVFCDARKDQLVDCFDSRGDDDPAVRRAKLAEEGEAFRALLAGRPNWTTVNVHDVNIEDRNAWTQVMIDVIGSATRVSPFANGPAHLMGAYVGARWPKVLLVGDRRNPRDNHISLPWPFVPWTPTSGHWMFNALAYNSVPVDELGVINGQERLPEELRALWTAIGEPPVVSLGSYARSSLRNAGIPVTVQTNHPQWWRRFKHRERAAFAQQVWSAAK